MPQEWIYGKLEDLCSRKQDSCMPCDAGLKVYVGLEHIEPGRFFVKSFGKPDQVVSSKNSFGINDILYGKLRPYLDKASVMEVEGICSTDILVLAPKNRTPAIFVVGLLHTDKFIQYAKQTTHGVNHPRTSWPSLREFPIQIPPLLEQQKIAAILFKIQKAIEIQESIIEKTRELKKSTLHHVFTHGLRGEELKETEIGQIPKSWVFNRINNLVSETTQRDPSKAPEHKIKYIDVSSISNTRYIIETWAYLLGKDAPSRARKVVEEGDVIVATVRPTLRRIAYITPDFNNEICSTAFCVLHPKRGVLDERYLFYAIQRDEFFAGLEKLQQGASYPAVADSDVKDQWIPVPSIAEQNEISFYFQVIDQKIELHTAKKSALKDLFKTMLNKLMTGEIRVKDLDIDISEVSA
jgi:type I restriction enzyme, S subunit